MVVDNLLCITLPRASRTACEVKFSEGIRFIKCFWRFFSCSSGGVSLVGLTLVVACDDGPC